MFIAMRAPSGQAMLGRLIVALLLAGPPSAVAVAGPLPAGSWLEYRRRYPRAIIGTVSMPVGATAPTKNSGFCKTQYRKSWRPRPMAYGSARDGWAAGAGSCARAAWWRRAWP